VAGFFMPTDSRDHAISLACIMGVYGDEDDGTGRTYEQAMSNDDLSLFGSDEAVEMDRDWSRFRFGSQRHR
jgi:hypothetical protein